MSIHRDYTSPDSRQSLDDDHESDADLDLDIDEFDPQSASSHPSTSNAAKASFDFSKDIPLRNLRLGGRRGYKRATRDRYHDEDDDADDLRALVGDDQHDAEASQQRPAAAPKSEDDVMPPRSTRLRRLSEQSQSAYAKFKAFISASSRRRRLPIDDAPDDDDEDHGPEHDHDPSSNRVISVGQRQSAKFPPNAVSNAKYTPVSFLPRTLYNEFSFFFNMYFLLVALSQTIPALRIGYLSTYIAPLAFVLAITLGKEALDDISRRRRDQEANSERYQVLEFDETTRPSSSGGAQSSTRRRNGPLGKIKSTGKGKGKSNGSMPNGDYREEEAAALTSNATPPSSNVRQVSKPSRDLKVGDVLVMTKDRRFPADVAILKSFSNETTSVVSEPVAVDTDDKIAKTEDDEIVNQTTSDDPSAGGEAFIRTDQLDGETDWKLRLAAPLAQNLPSEEFTRLRLTAGKPDRKVNDFLGTLELLPATPSMYDPYLAKDAHRGDGPSDALEQEAQPQSIPLSIDNTAWANTVLASSSTVYAVVLYTGPQTRAALSTSASRSKTGLLEWEINSLTKILCFLTLALSFVLVALEGFDLKDGQPWYVSVMRFLILFSTIVPISLRVNLDMGKSVYAWFIERDTGIPGTVVRTSTIPEDLGRIEYLLSDKTGTLTQNEMELKKVHVGTVSYANEAMDEVATYIRSAFADMDGFFTPSSAASTALASGTRSRREIAFRVRDLVLALALCHNVTPTTEEKDGETVVSYQASSPDEIAIVQWTEHVGLRLLHRDRKTITLQSAGNNRIVVRVQILNVFPFTSDSKRMGIVVKFMHSPTATNEDGDIYFFQKGADTVMTNIVAANDWLDEETANMAREGLRTLVIGRRPMSRDQYSSFSTDYAQAGLSFHDRDHALARVVKQHLEHDLELLGVTGVEDKLQHAIKPSLELLRNAGIKIWMLTGDKVETARCVAVSAKLVSRGQYIHTIAGLKRKEAALDALSLLQSRPNAALLIDGQSLQVYLTHHRDAFIQLAVKLPAVIACRCSPTQKADVAHLIRRFTGKRTLCIGDGGNDVSMIQAADVGVGIVGKEGRQASLAADFSITQFAHLTKLLVWHGRNSYKRSAKLAQFVIHRGLIISVAQTVFSVASSFEPIALYRDWLLVGYATCYTMMPVFSLVLDRDVDEDLANLYPELYRELTTGRSLSYRSFFIWVAISVYQGIVLQGGSQLLVPGFSNPVSGAPDADGVDAVHAAQGFKQMVSLSFTALVINELVMVAAEITTWHPVNIATLLGTAAIYFASIPFLGAYFDLQFIVSVGFLWRVAAVSAVALVPVYAGKLIRRAVRPPSYRKVRGV